MVDAYPIGTVFKRREPHNDSLDEIRVVGGGHSLVVTSNTEFGPPKAISLKELFEEFVDENGHELQEPETATRRMSPAEFFEKQNRDQRAAEAAGAAPAKSGGRRAAKPSD